MVARRLKDLQILEPDPLPRAMEALLLAAVKFPIYKKNETFGAVMICWLDNYTRDWRRDVSAQRRQSRISTVQGDVCKPLSRNQNISSGNRGISPPAESV